jgi:hypothetical protein
MPNIFLSRIGFDIPCQQNEHQNNLNTNNKPNFGFPKTIKEKFSGDKTFFINVS